MRSLTFQRLLGSGAFGSVYLAELAADRGFRRQVAVKVLLRDHGNGDMFMSRVRDEARLLGLLADDHILKVLELAKVEGRDAVLMEFVEGVDLNAIVEGGFRPPPRALAELGAAVAGALHRAHCAVHPSTGEPLNVIHRDVKPANVMVTSRGSVKLLDFGVARARFEARESHTGQFVLGTLNYMAPEYIVTGDVSPAADLYGLALTLWEAASGDVFGQPKLREDLHKARVEERLALIASTHSELVPVLRQMLGWDARSRPDGASVERAFLDAMDMLRGTGLRSWAADAVPKVLAREREAARDEVGLLGKTVPIGELEGLPSDNSRVGARPDAAAAPVAAPSPAAPARPEPSPVTPPARAPFDAPPPRGEAVHEPAESTIHHAPRPAFLSDTPAPTPTMSPPPAAAPNGPSAPGPRPSGSTPRRPKKKTSGNMLLLQGLVLGGGLGILLLIAVGALLLLRNFL
jgi:serine/threonine protein kinase